MKVGAALAIAVLLFVWIVGIWLPLAFVAGFFAFPLAKPAIRRIV